MDFKDRIYSVAEIVGISSMGEKIPAAAGRISTLEGDTHEILEKSQDAEKNANLIKKVTHSNHTSILEHTVYNIAFRNVSILAEQFMIEFRLASFTVKSRRYVNFGSMGFYVPELDGDICQDEFKKSVRACLEDYNALLDRGIPKEDARFILPYCVFSNFYCTVNARELLNIIRSALYGRGRLYPEIKSLGEQLMAQIAQMTPGIAASLSDSRPELSDRLSLSYLFKAKEGANERPKNANEKSVELISYTSDAEKTVAKAALTASTQYPLSEIEKLLEDDGNLTTVLDKVIACSRPRSLEAAVYTFRINGVSLSEITHFARHRMQSIEIPSYTLIDGKRYVIPETVKKDPVALEIYINAFERMDEVHKKLKNAGMPEEELVYLRLSGSKLDIMVTMNARELLLFFRLRTCTRAQWEIRGHAIEMLRILREVSPGIFNRFGPSCFVSKCTEGTLTCGRMDDMKKIFDPMNKSLSEDVLKEQTA